MSDFAIVIVVKVTAKGIRVDRGFEVHDHGLRTAATAALGRGQPLDDWLAPLAVSAVRVEKASAPVAATDGNAACIG